MKIHNIVTVDRVISTVERNNSRCENTGICLACGEDQDGCEPDARKYECECCGEKAVYGAEECLFIID